jgi:hypothetical protein
MDKQRRCDRLKLLVGSFLVGRRAQKDCLMIYPAPTLLTPFILSLGFRAKSWVDLAPQSFGTHTNFLVIVGF